MWIKTTFDQTISSVPQSVCMNHTFWCPSHSYDKACCGWYMPQIILWIIKNFQCCPHSLWPFAGIGHQLLCSLYCQTDIQDPTRKVLRHSSYRTLMTPIVSLSLSLSYCVCVSSGTFGFNSLSNLNRGFGLVSKHTIVVLPPQALSGGKYGQLP